MAKAVKYLLYAIGLLFFLSVIAIALLPLLIDPNAYKSQIAKAVEKHSGRELTIEGDLDLSLFPWIGVQTGPLKLGNAPGFGAEPFAAIAEADVKVKLIPLLTKKIEINRIVLKGLQLNLEKNAQGQANWEDLVKAAKRKEAPAQEPSAEESGREKPVSIPPLAGLIVNGIAIEDARVNWHDRSTGERLNINDINARLDKLVFGQPVDVKLAFTLLKERPAIKGTASLTAKLIIHQDLNQYQIEDLKLKSRTEGESIPGKALEAQVFASMAADLSQQTLEISGLQLKSADLSLTSELKGEKILQDPLITGPVKLSRFSPRKLMHELEIKAPETRDPSALNQLSAQFDLKASPKELVLNNIQLQLDETQIKGKALLRNFAKPAIAFNLNADALDVDRYLPPPQAKQPKEPVPMPAAAIGAASQELPLDTLRHLDLQGELHIAALKMGGLKMQGVKLVLQGKDGLITLDQAAEKLYQGRYQGASRLNVQGKEPVISINEHLAGVEIEPLFLDAIGKAPASGTTEFTARLTGRGKDIKKLKSSLNGDIVLKIQKGSLNDLQLIQTVREAKALFEGEPVPLEEEAQRIAFEELNALATVTDGVIHTDKLVAHSAKLKLTGKGTVDLKDNRLDYKLRAVRLKKKKDDQSGEEVLKETGLPVIIALGGTLKDLTYGLDVEQMALEKGKAKLEKKKEKLYEKLDKAVGEGAGDILKRFLR